MKLAEEKILERHSAEPDNLFLMIHLDGMRRDARHTSATVKGVFDHAVEMPSKRRK